MSSSDDRIRDPRGPLRKTMLIVGLTMTLFFIGFGAWILLDPNAMAGMQPQYRTIFGATVLIYGIFRGWRIYNDYIK